MYFFLDEKVPKNQDLEPAITKIYGTQTSRSKAVRGVYSTNVLIRHALSRCCLAQGPR